MTVRLREGGYKRLINVFIETISLPRTSSEEFLAIISEVNIKHDLNY